MSASASTMLPLLPEPVLLWGSHAVTPRLEPVSLSAEAAAEVARVQVGMARAPVEHPLVQNVNVSLPRPDFPLVFVNSHVSGLYVHAMDVWEQLVRSGRRVLFVSWEEPPFGYPRELEEFIWIVSRTAPAPGAWMALQLVRAYLRRSVRSVLHLSHAALIPYFFDLMAERAAIVHSDRYFDALAFAGRHRDAELPHSDRELFQEVAWPLHVGGIGTITPSFFPAMAAAYARGIAACRRYGCWLHSQAARLREFFPEHARKIVHAPPTVDTQRFAPCAEPRRPRLLFTTSMPGHAREKGLALLDHLARDLPESVELLCVLPGSRDAAIGGLHPRIRFESAAREEMPRLFATALAYCRLSTTDSIPLSVLQAMACATPVIVSPLIAQNLPIVEDGVTALVLDPGSPEHASAAIERLLDDPKRLEALGERARRSVRAHAFTVTAWDEQTLPPPRPRASIHRKSRRSQVLRTP